MSSSTNTSKPAFYSSCDVADALLVLGHPAAGYVPDLHLWSPEYKAGNTRRESSFSSIVAHLHTQHADPPCIFASFDHE